MKRFFLIGALTLLAGALSATAYYVDPVAGNDSANGSQAAPWKSFAPVNRLTLVGGDRLEIIQGGPLTETLMPHCAASADYPVVIHFAPGRYDFMRERLFQRPFAISNTNDDPNGLKKVAVYLKEASGVQFIGNETFFFMRGKMLQMVLENCSDISVDGIHFDYHRPTVSEFTIVGQRGLHKLARVNGDSAYEIRNGKLFWIGEGWEMKAGGYYQELIQREDRLHRAGMDFLNGIRVKEAEPGLLELSGIGLRKYQVGNTYQNRDIFRDYCSFFIDRSQNITFQNSAIHYMHGMGVVSQFSENLTFFNMDLSPRAESGRTIAAWADFLHFSGCKGLIRIEKVFFSGANDDSVNVHGTHLKVTSVNPAQNSAVVRFMHPQTYNFQPFYPEDAVAFINSSTLLAEADNRVKEAQRLNEKEWKLTFYQPLPPWSPAFYLENVSHSADVLIKDCETQHAPTRGFLLTTRGKVVVENNLLKGTSMTGILVSDDANYWFESGMVKDMTLKNNRFVGCRQPNITILPETKILPEGKWVHENIRILNNTFTGIDPKQPVIFAKSVKGLTLTGQRVKTDCVHCTEVSDQME